MRRSILDLSRRIAAAVVFAVLGAALAGCPNNSESGGAVETCERVGEQCKLGGGQLGVCTMDTEGDMKCEPQH